MLHSVQPGALRRGVARVASIASARARRSWRFLGATVLLASAFDSAAAQSTGMALMMSGPLGLPMSRTGSGTTWLPDSAPMFGVMRSAGSWGIMAHASVFAQANAQGGDRGDTQFGSLNWAMAGATHALAGGRLQLRGMVSLDAFTVGNKGYPLLLQTGESYRGEALHDRQHPHDVFMEIAAVYDRALTDRLAMQLYVAPAGEPATGPVAFPHRPSAAADPFATLTHHWQDATHVSFGVLSAALYSRTVKLEGSLFNGREPDDIRTNLDYRRARLDALAGRITVNPDAYSSFSASYARMPDAEVAHPGEAVHRATASLLHTRPRSAGGSLSLSLIGGMNGVSAKDWTPGITAEVLRDIRGRGSLFMRAEYVRKSGEELVLDDHGGHDTPVPPAKEHETLYGLTALTLGGIRELVVGKGGTIGLGVRGTLNVVPSSLEHAYGSRTPLGGALFLRWRPARMAVAPAHDEHKGH